MTYFGSVQTEIVDGAAGLAPPGGPFALVTGISSQGVIGAPVLVGKDTDLVKAFGIGPLVERLMDIQAEADENLNVVAVRTAQAVAGAVGALIQTKTGTGTQALTGSPTRRVHVVVVATGAGGNGTALVKYSLDGGFSFSTPQTLPANGALVLGDSGLTLTYTDALVPANSVAVNDKWEAKASEPRPSFVSVLTNNQLAIDTYLPQVIHVVGASDETDWAAAAMEAAILFDAGSPAWFLMEAAPPNELTGETVDAWVTGLVGKPWTGKWVNVSAGYGWVFNAKTGEKQRRPLSGRALGRLARVGDEVSLGRTRDGSLQGVELDANYNNAHARALDDAGYTTTRVWKGLFGVYWSNGRMKATVGSDYQFVEVVRVSHWAVRATRVPALLQVGSNLDPDMLPVIKATMDAPLDRGSAMIPRKILKGEVIIPPGQDIVNNGLVYDINLDGVPVIRQIKIRQRFRFGKVL